MGLYNNNVIFCWLQAIKLGLYPSSYLKYCTFSKNDQIIALLPGVLFLIDRNNTFDVPHISYHYGCSEFFSNVLITKTCHALLYMKALNPNRILWLRVC